MTKLHELQDLGQSPWLNYMRREFIVTGGLRETISQGIQGITANAAVFEETIRNDIDYDESIREHIRAGTPTTRIHEALMVDDVQRAADLLHPVFEETAGLDGIASLEIDPAYAADSVGTVATARRLLARVDRGNAMVEIPATHAGAEAVQALTEDGVNINATHIFSVSDFERIAQAYISGLECYFETHSVWRMTPTAVASFSVNPIDKAVDKKLAQLDHPELQGQVAIAVARLLYERYREIFSGPRWQRLASRGARPLRPKWTRLSVYQSRQAATAYMDALIGSDTVITFTPETLELFLAQGRAVRTLHKRSDSAMSVLQEVAELGIDLEQLAIVLQQEYIEAADRRYQALIAAVIQTLVTEAPYY
jgi:transaldolase